MKKIWWILYNLILFPLLYLFFKIARIFNAKIRSGFDRRRVQNKFLIEEIKLLDKSKK